ncbi:MAG TPA: LPS assembly lipoprotein LptE [Pirellulaceae bacterium]|nr:LPS assembly lipoprotein LptE [Pirellulaceae bacterium]
MTLAAATGLAGITSFLSGCAGYQVGARSMYCSDVRTVHVPIIESDSYRRQLGERLTEAVIKEIELNSPYKVVGSPDGADSVLRCRLISDQKTVTAETRTDEPRADDLAMTVQVDWLDRRNQSLIQRSEIPLPSSIVTISARSSLIAEAGQSVATAQQESLQRLARQIREQMESAW